MAEAASFLWGPARTPGPLAQAGALGQSGPTPPGLTKPRLTKRGRNPMTRFPLHRAACDPGGVAERLKAAGCKSADVRLRRFESYPLHQRFEFAAGIAGSAMGS